MSGLSMAVGPLPEQAARQVDCGGFYGRLMGSLNTVELQLMAFLLVFAASGLVPLPDILFPVLVTAYLALLDRLVFPGHGHGYGVGDGDGMQVFHGSRNFELYLSVGTVLGLFFPLAYVLGAFARGDRPAVKAVTPHLFLLSAQVLSENIIGSTGIFSPPVRALVAMIYTTRRLFSLSDWVNTVFFAMNMPIEPKFKDVAWMWFGRGLASANIVYFNINMFCFLIPRFLPRAFERYIAAKAVHGTPHRSDGHEKKPEVQKKRD